VEHPKSQWARIVENDPGHSARYVQRFKTMAAQGADLVGEARLIDALVPRGAAILDAGCGPGRHAGHLHRAGHTVVGVDLDPVLIEAAETDDPGPVYVVGDLASFALPADTPARYDAILCAGNVLGFVHPDTRRPILANLRALLAENGRLAVGFGAGRGYAFDDFFADAAAVGLVTAGAFSTWDLRPFTETSDFLVALLTR
jgi:SAM-dependent methyltransferase